MYVHYGAQQTHQQVTVTGPRPDTAGQGPGTATGTNIRVVSSYRLGRMVQGRRSRQRAPGSRRRPAWLHASLLHAPCSPMATGHGQDPAHRSPNIPPVPPSAGDGLHCVEIQLLHCMASRRYGPPAAACWLAWLGWKEGARGGEPGVESGLGDVERWGAMARGETDRKTLPAVPSAVVPGAAVGSRPARKGTTERDVDGIFGARACAVVDTLAEPGSHGQPQLAPLGRGTGTESELRLRIA